MIYKFSQFSYDQECDQYETRNTICFSTVERRRSLKIVLSIWIEDVFSFIADLRNRTGDECFWCSAGSEIY